jgi:hypothetical protein
MAKMMRKTISTKVKKQGLSERLNNPDKWMDGQFIAGGGLPKPRFSPVSKSIKKGRGSKF